MLVGRDHPQPPISLQVPPENFGEELVEVEIGTALEPKRMVRISIGVAYFPMLLPAVCKTLSFVPTG